MSSKQLGVILKRFESPDEVRVMQKGKFELVHIGGMTIGRANYEPGWKWSEHVGPTVGATRCHVEHVGLVLSGAATAAFDDGRVVELHAGELFHIPPIPHDSWSSAMSRTCRSTFSAPSATRNPNGNKIVRRFRRFFTDSETQNSSHQIICVNLCNLWILTTNAYSRLCFSTR